ncbi:MAG: class I SAM-dependent rRNA methyltransferase [Deltaproteobacteria bacterium]|nr:class I SAM-dependent rRNA methyltransferase [Deltaproteobacteria bacterium]
MARHLKERTAGTSPVGPTRAQLRKPVERALVEGHPWIWRDALAPFDARAGDVVTVLDRRGAVLAKGIADDGPIAVRVFAVQVLDGDGALDAALFRTRIESAATLRRRVVPPDTTAYRLLHGEGDRLPGVVCDVYGEHAVLAFDGQGASAWRDVVVDGLRPVLDGLGVTSLLLRIGRGDRRAVTAAYGEVPGDPIEVRERGMRLLVDLVHGQKTGLFLDHRESRRRVREIAGGLRVANLYAYTGGFSVAAGLGGATRVTTVDVAPPAIELARATWMRNELDAERHHAVVADVPKWLGAARVRGDRYGLVIADPPSFAPSETTLPAALDSYRALHAASLALVEPGGIYLAASCSSHVTMAAFEDTLRAGARQAKRVLQVLSRTGAPEDHPRLLGFPEGDYLKVLLTRVV